MSWLQFVALNLRHNALGTAVNLILLVLGTASIALLLLATHHFQQQVSRDAQGIDLVIGAKGSPLQLVLSSVYHADMPTGNIPLESARRWRQDPRVQAVIPLSLGDSHRGYRIVGTTHEYPSLYAAKPQAGRLWEQPMEIVAGTTAAQQANIAVGDRFAGAHGLAEGGHRHQDRLYHVVGILQPTGTVLDRLLLTSLQSVWAVHGDAHDEDQHHMEPSGESDDGHHDEDKHHAHRRPENDHDHAEDEALEDHSHIHQEKEADRDFHGHHDEHDHDHDNEGGDGENDEGALHHEGEHPHNDADREVTALLIQYATPMAALSLPREVNAQPLLQAAVPAKELTRLLQFIGVGRDLVLVFAGLLILGAALSILAALYNALRTRRFDLAMLRCLGATRLQLLQCILLEGVVQTAVGLAVGVALGHGILAAMNIWLPVAQAGALSPWVWLPQETALLGVVLLLGLLASALPAWQAYRTDVAHTLGGQ
nr:ABC transporter permease [Oceanococcus sp. HetDA_MAG_MS8]